LDLFYYLELQRRMFDVFRYVSCHEKNFRVHSIILESLLVDVCSFFDSLCQTLVREKVTQGHTFKNQIPKLNDKVNGNIEFNFGDYRALFESEFLLSGRVLDLVRYEGVSHARRESLDPKTVIGFPVEPFREWPKADSSPWWRAFTDLKHDRLKNFHQATLENCIYAMAAVFVVLTLRHEADFKRGGVPAEIYDLFFPKYWTFSGRVMPGIVRWK
jgi:hypothetical protein